MKTFVCQVCDTQTPDAFLHKHHQKPQAAGGTDKDIINICSSCHQRIHSLAYMLMNPKRKPEVEGVLQLYFPNHNTRKKIINLANIVALEMSARADKGLISGEEKQVMFTLDSDSYYKLLVSAKDKRIAVTNHAKAIIMEWLRKN